MQSTVVLYEGPSAINGDDIVVIVSGLRRKSQNDKTGVMAQTWILNAGDVDPVNAVRQGLDEAQCGDCPFRPSIAGTTGVRCYVQVGRAPLGIWKSYKRGLPKVDPAVVGQYLAEIGRPVRLGAYGDPTAAPLEVWQALLASGVEWTGYTHQWRRQFADGFQSILMASADSVKDRASAMRKGWRTFRVVSHGETLADGEIACPASAEAGHRTTCAKCRLCSGKTGRSDRRKTIGIIDHGPTAPRKRAA